VDKQEGADITIPRPIEVLKRWPDLSRGRAERAPYDVVPSTLQKHEVLAARYFVRDACCWREEAEVLRLLVATQRHALTRSKREGQPRLALFKNDRKKKRSVAW